MMPPIRPVVEVTHRGTHPPKYPQHNKKQGKSPVNSVTQSKTLAQTNRADIVVPFVLADYSRKQQWVCCH